jgi:hypothetical protein
MPQREPDAIVEASERYSIVYVQRPALEEEGRSIATGLDDQPVLGLLELLVPEPNDVSGVQFNAHALLLSLQGWC